MADLVFVHASGLRDAKPAFDALSASVEATLRRLAAALAAEGACWGADTMGATFAASYTPAADQVRQAFPMLRDGIGDVATALRLVAENATGSDARASARLV